MQKKLEQIYNNPKILEQFTHPYFKKKFKYLTHKKIIFLANKISTKILSSQIKNIIVIESGASIFANICKKITDKEKKLNWIFLKFPREPTSNIYPIISNLTKNKSNKLKSICEKIPIKKTHSKRLDLNKLVKNTKHMQNKYHKAVFNIVKDSKISKILNEPFLIFEDYITSGHTINLVIDYLKYFSDNLNFKIACYYLNLQNNKKLDNILISLYNKSSKLKAFNFGVYPYENRIDLLGYFYLINKETYKKVYIKNLIKKNKKDKIKNMNIFLDELRRTIKKNNLIQKIKEKIKISDVKKFIDENHLIRYYLYIFEKELNNDKITKEFLWLAFDMYGPIWYPLPITYHIEFMEAFNKNEKIFKDINNFNDLLNNYKLNKNQIISKISKTFNLNKNANKKYN